VVERSDTTGRFDKERSNRRNEAVGFKAISRWLSEATPPESLEHEKPHPGGMPAVIKMPSTFTSLHYHIVFSTKERKPHLDSAWRDRLHEYLGGTINGLGGFSEAIGGVDDHMHLLIGMKAMHCLADFMRELKKASSGWVRKEMRNKTFAWQEGYGAFTVSPTAPAQVRDYIANQEEHHRKKSFREELEELLLKAGVKYEKRYLD
jgi:REP element-mobilizing transposase RayT